MGGDGLLLLSKRLEKEKAALGCTWGEGVAYPPKDPA